MKSALNPQVIIEVLSDSTEEVDRGEKWRCYQLISSLQQYVLVAQDLMQVEIYTKNGDVGKWGYQSFTHLDDVPKIGECEILMGEIYRKVVFPPPNAQEEPLPND